MNAATTQHLDLIDRLRRKIAELERENKDLKEKANKNCGDNCDCGCEVVCKNVYKGISK